MGHAGPMATPVHRRGLAVLIAALVAIGVGTATETGLKIVGTSMDNDPARPHHVGPYPAPVASRWTALALGDSVATGAGCDCRPYPDRYASLVTARTGVPTTVVNRADNGLTSADLRDRVEHDPTLAGELGRSDIVTVTIGANDLGDALSRWRDDGCLSCFDVPARQVGRDVDAVLDRIATLRAGHPTEVLVTTYWNIFQDGRAADDADDPDFATMSRHATGQVNEELCVAARAHGAACIDLDAAFQRAGVDDPTPFLAADADHPSASGHDVIAAALAAHGWAELGRS